MRRLAVGLFAAVAAMTFTSTADAHRPSQGFAEQRVVETNYDGNCGRGVALCARRISADCSQAWGDHSRLCVGEYMAVAGFHFYRCWWQGRVEHDGNVVTHWKNC